jgi:hypothetical protein
MSSDQTMSATPTAIQSQPRASQYSAADVELIDDYLNKAEQEQMYVLAGPRLGLRRAFTYGQRRQPLLVQALAGFWEVPTAGLDRHTQAEQELSQYPQVEAIGIQSVPRAACTRTRWGRALYAALLPTSALAPGLGGRDVVLQRTRR